MRIEILGEIKEALRQSYPGQINLVLLKSVFVNYERTDG